MKLIDFFSNISNLILDLVEVLKSDVQDRRGLHQQQYHNEAKIYQKENPHLSYRDALKFIYSHKINKNI